MVWKHAGEALNVVSCSACVEVGVWYRGLFLYKTQVHLFVGVKSALQPEAGDEIRSGVSFLKLYAALFRSENRFNMCF